MFRPPTTGTCADQHAEHGDWRAAVRDRFRALVRELEVRTILDVRPARTAWEAAYAASRLLPGCRDDLRTAAEDFSAVMYGERRADETLYRRMAGHRRSGHGGGRHGGPRRQPRQQGCRDGRNRPAGFAGPSDLAEPAGTLDRCQPWSWRCSSWSRSRCSRAVSGASEPRIRAHPRRQGAGALGQLLSDEGIRISTADRVGEASTCWIPRRRLVVATPEPADGGRGPAADGSSPGASHPAAAAGYRARGVRCSGRGDAAAAGRVPAGLPGGRGDARRTDRGGRPGGRLPARAGPPRLACYPTGGGYAYLRVAGTARDGRPGGRWPVQCRDRQGGQRRIRDEPPRLAAPAGLADGDSTPEAGGSTGGGGTQPTLLPSWWQIGVVQAVVALVVVGIWRGRRLGPILTEPLPVTVRASETVEGHGRLYYRLGARDRAAEALADGDPATTQPILRRCRRSRGAGRGDCPADRRARRTRSASCSPAPAPATDDELVALANHLDRLERGGSPTVTQNLAPHLAGPDSRSARSGTRSARQSSDRRQRSPRWSSRCSAADTSCSRACRGPPRRCWSAASPRRCGSRPSGCSSPRT